mgnify:CR=1 FL=1
MSQGKIWLIAIAIILVDLAVFMIPIVPIIAAYILVMRPPWFKAFIDDVYRPDASDEPPHTT